ncbi:putative transglutaminase [Caudoviricetes sp.]|nr:putative transglutaminase [Caudoviricetes sp.]
MKALNIFALGAGGGVSALDQTSYATASVTPTSGRTSFLVSLALRAAGTITTPTASGAGLTWTGQTPVANAAGTLKLTVFSAPNTAPSAGAVTVDFAGQTQDAHAHLIFEVDEATGVVQIVSGSVTAGTTYNMTAAAAAATGNALLAIFGCAVNTGSLRPEQGYVVPASSSAAVVAVPFRDAAGLSLAFGFRPEISDLTCTVTQGSGDGIGFLIELRNPNAVQAGSYTLSGTVTTDGATPVSGATVRVIDRTTGDSKTTTTDVNGDWSMSVSSNTAGRYAAMAEYEDGGDRFNSPAPWYLTAA